MQVTKYIVHYTDLPYSLMRIKKEFKDVSKAIDWAMENHHLDTEVERLTTESIIIWSSKDE